MRDTKIVTAEVGWCADDVFAESVKIKFSKAFQSKVIQAQELINQSDHFYIRSIELHFSYTEIEILELLNDEEKEIDECQFTIGSFDVAVTVAGILLTIYSKYDGGEQIEVGYSNDILLDKEVSHA